MRGRPPKQQNKEELPPRVSLEEELLAFQAEVKKKPILSRLEHINHQQIAVVMDGHKFVLPSDIGCNVRDSGVSYPVGSMPQPVKNLSVIKRVSKNFDTHKTEGILELVFEFESGATATASFFCDP